jgi:hypothetical protein
MLAADEKRDGSGPDVPVSGIPRPVEINPWIIRRFIGVTIRSKNNEAA